ncbi:MAG: hypothetical protein U0840_02770 [Gemmataceae bacterium]
MADVEALVRDDMRALSDARVAAHVFSLLADPPRPVRLGWTFGAVGETLDGFLVLDHPRSGTGIVYCEQGFGPANPWGLVFTDRGPLSTGTSDGWYPRLLDAYFESKASADVPIWRVRVWRTSRDGAWVSGELPWDEAWARVAELRASAPHAQYYSDHSVRY